MATKRPNRMDAGFPGGVTPSGRHYLVVVLPSDFPVAPEAFELVAYAVASACQTWPQGVDISYRAEPDPFAHAITLDRAKAGGPPS